MKTLMFIITALNLISFVANAVTAYQLKLERDTLPETIANLAELKKEVT